MKPFNYSVIIHLAVIFFTVNITFAQVFDKEPDKRILSISKSLLDSTRTNPEKYLPILTQTLTFNVTDEFEKVKIIHDWIATEITYDNEIYLRTTDLVHKTHDVLKKKKAICVGYCNLFSRMCGYAGIECVSITGYAKSVNDKAKSLPEKFTRPNHQWNAVRINSNWYLIDVTWDAGYSLKDDFIFQYSTTYLFQDPEVFITNHYPQDEKWQLLKKPVSWSEFRELKFTEPVNKLSLDNTSIKGGINFSKLYSLSIPGITETKGFNLSLSANKGITNELGIEAELSFDHMNINQDLSLLLPSSYFNSERSTYIDPLTHDPVDVGSFNFEKLGIGVNLKYHMQNETSILPFLKTGFSISTPFSFSSSQKGIVVSNAGKNEVIRVNNLNFLDQLLYGVLISAGADLVRKEGPKNNFLPVLGIELRWSFILNSLKLFEDYDEGQNKFKSYSINLMFYL